MEQKHLQTAYDALRIRFRAALIVGGVLLLVVFCLAAALARQTEPPVVLVPTRLAQEASVSADAVSESYVVAIAYDVALTLLNTTPANLEWRRETLLRVIHPAAYGDFAAQLDEEAARIRRAKASSVFYPVQFETKSLADRPQVNVTGDLHTIISKTETSRQRITLSLVFTRDARGALMLVEAKTEEKSK